MLETDVPGRWFGSLQFVYIKQWVKLLEREGNHPLSYVFKLHCLVKHRDKFASFPVLDYMH
jgi:hypothetical protein